MSTPHLDGRPLLAVGPADELRSLFKALANSNRLRILHSVHLAGELCVNDIAEATSLTAQAVSNHLQRLADQGVVASRRDAHRVLYRIVDPCVPGLMDLGICLVEERRNPSSESPLRLLRAAELLRTVRFAPVAACPPPGETPPA